MSQFPLADGVVPMPGNHDEHLYLRILTADEISPAQQATMEEATHAIHRCMENIGQNIVEAGKQLARVKEFLPHGRFLTWIEDEFGLHERTAQRWMNVAERLGAKDSLVRRLKTTALYELARPSTPEKAIAIVEQRLQAGEELTGKQVKAIIETCRPQSHAVEEDPVPVAERLVTALRTACTALSNRTVADCEQVLGEELAERLDEIRRELDWLLEKIPSHLPAAPAQSAQWTVVAESARDMIGPGATVHLIEGDSGQAVSYTIVADEPSDPAAGRLNADSPLAQALRNKQLGEEAIISTPKGETFRYTITAIDDGADRQAG